MKKKPENRIPVSVGIPFNLLMIIDEEAEQKNLSRSEYIVQILKDRHNKQN